MARKRNDTADLPCLVAVGPRLRAAMAHRGLSTWRLARESGVSQAVISKLMTGTKRNPQLSTVLRLCRALGMTIEGLLAEGEIALAGKSG